MGALASSRRLLFGNGLSGTFQTQCPRPPYGMTAAQKALIFHVPPQQIPDQAVAVATARLVADRAALEARQIAVDTTVPSLSSFLDESKKRGFVRQLTPRQIDDALAQYGRKYARSSATRGPFRG